MRAGFLIAVLAVQPLLALASTPCGELDALIAQHGEAWTKHSDLETLERTSPLYKKMRSILDSPWPAEAEARKLWATYGKFMEARDATYTLTWAERIDPLFALDIAVETRWALEPKIRDLLMKGAFEELIMPHMMVHLREFGDLPSLTEEAALISAKMTVLLFIAQHATRTERESLKRLFVKLKQTPLWPLLGETEFGKLLAGAARGLWLVP